MDDDNITEDNCVICKEWPAAERAERRSKHFSTDYILMPIKGVCIQCQLVFWTAMGLLTPEDEAPQEPPSRH